MTLASLAGVGVLAAQAARAAPQVSSKPRAASPARPTAGPTSSTSSTAGANPAALPDGSGSGARVVYGETARRVWIVASNGTVERTFPIVPGTVPAPAGTFHVSHKVAGETGSDGTPVQYVVLFAQRSVGGTQTAFGFDTVANISGLPPAPSSRTGGVRMAQLDAQALWNFVSLGTPVVVVP